MVHSVMAVYVRRLVIPRLVASVAALAMGCVGSIAEASPKGDVAADWFAGAHALPSHPHGVMDPAASMSRGMRSSGARGSIGRTRAGAASRSTHGSAGATRTRTSDSTRASSSRISPRTR